MAKYFGDDFDSYNPTTAAGRGASNKAEQNDKREAYKEKTIFQNKYHEGNTFFNEQTSHKRKESKNYKRSNQVNLNPDEEDQDADFDAKKNANYEDEHTADNIAQVKAEMKKMTAKDKQEIIEGFAGIMKSRKAGYKNLKNVKEKQSDEFENETITQCTNIEDFLKRVDGNDKKTVEELKANTDWLFSNERNKDKLPSVTNKSKKKDKKKDGDKNDDDDSDSDSHKDEFVKKKIKISNNEKTFFEERLNPDDALDVDENGNPVKPAGEVLQEAQEFTIKIKKTEIDFVKSVTEKLYGQAINDQDYINLIERKIKNETNVISVDGFDPSKEIALNDTHASELDIDEDFEVKSQAEKIKKSTAAINGENLVPEIDWSKTVYGKKPAKYLLKLNPFMFIVKNDAKEALINDEKLFIPLDCALRKIQLNFNEKEKRFEKIGDWSQHLRMCDIYHANTIVYLFKDENIGADKLMVLDDKDDMFTDPEEKKRKEEEKKKENIKKEEQTKKIQRMVIYHDLKNGFFVCNHFQLEPKNIKEDSEKTEGKYNFIWLNYCYLECINRKE